MNFFKDKIVFTGGSGKFGKIFKKKYHTKNLFFPSKQKMDIENYSSIKKFLSKIKPKILIHAAAISRPMKLHNQQPEKSIKTNIIGTSNLVIACKELGIKIIYFSTNYVYPATNKVHKETDPLLPINMYAFSKLGGECAVQMYHKSLILRISMTERPFIYKNAYGDVFTNFFYHDEVVRLFPKIINYNGILNIGGKIRSFYNFAKLSNSDVKKTVSRKKNLNRLSKFQVIDTKKLKNILN